MKEIIEKLTLLRAELKGLRNVINDQYYDSCSMIQHIIERNEKLIKKLQAESEVKDDNCKK